MSEIINMKNHDNRNQAYLRARALRNHIVNNNVDVNSEEFLQAVVALMIDWSFEVLGFENEMDG